MIRFSIKGITQSDILRGSDKRYLDDTLVIIERIFDTSPTLEKPQTNMCEF